LYLILPPATWKIASLLRDTGGMLITAGLLGNIRVVPSDAATDTGTAVLIDAKGIAADAGSVELDATIEAAIQAEGDNPTAGATTLISLFQNNLTGIRVERRFSAELMRSDSAACITGYETTA
jgi:hypothetical protein